MNPSQSEALLAQSVNLSCLYLLISVKLSINISETKEKKPVNDLTLQVTKHAAHMIGHSMAGLMMTEWHLLAEPHICLREEEGTTIL